MTRADLLVGVEHFVALRIVGGEAGRQLAAVLQIEQHSRHQTRNLLRPRERSQSRWRGMVEVINRANTALMVQFVHALQPGSKEGWKQNPANGDPARS